MGYDAHTPGTTKARLPLPLNGTIYTTTRDVPSEKPLVEIGGTMAAELGPAYASSYIIAVGNGPDRSKGLLTISHVTIPSEAAQLASNWEHTTCDIGGQKFDAVARTIVMLASAYSETSPASGSAMPAAAPFAHASYLLENRQTVRSGMELEPVFRVERRNYVKRVIIGEISPDPVWGYGIQKTTRLYYRGEIVVSTSAIETLAAAPTNAYWGVQTSGVIRECQQLTENWFAVIETTYTVPSEANQLATNWEQSDMPVGIGQFQGVTRDVIALASAYSTTSPALNSAMPVVSGGLFDGQGYVLYSRDAKKSGMNLEPVFRLERRAYIRKITVRQHDYDEQFGENLYTTQQLYHADEIVYSTVTAAALFAAPADSYWGLQSDGYVREGKQLTPDWYVITQREIVHAGFVGSGRSYTTAIDYSWPGVLSDISVDTWERKDGGLQRYARPIYSKEAYRGPCKAVVTETFHVMAPVVTVPNVMLPMPIDLSTPMFSLNIGPTLHPAKTVVVANGTNDPEFVSTAGSYTFPVTTPAAWPTSILASDEVRPFRGGYLRTQVTVYPPTYTA